MNDSQLSARLRESIAHERAMLSLSPVSLDCCPPTKNWEIVSRNSAFTVGAVDSLSLTDNRC
jgi:hypothetical protein